MKRTARQRRIENEREAERIGRFYNPLRSSPMFDSIEVVPAPVAVQTVTREAVEDHIPGQDAAYCDRCAQPLGWYQIDEPNPDAWHAVCCEIEHFGTERRP